MTSGQVLSAGLKMFGSLEVYSIPFMDLLIEPSLTPDLVP